MAVRIRLKKMGRKARPFFRFCAVDSRKPRDGKVIEELGYYDPMIRETDARVVLKGERVDYWLSVGAQPSDKASVLIKKYGSKGTHLEQQKAARDRMKTRPAQFQPPAKPAPVAAPTAEAVAEEPAATPEQE
ncbi:MAG: 30S ribosomal protein S16 [Pirellulaceae bacterium]|nr:30S ribosomal protein S16 [Pirellulaceae bacterium]